MDKLLGPRHALGPGITQGETECLAVLTRAVGTVQDVRLAEAENVIGKRDWPNPADLAGWAWQASP